MSIHMMKLTFSFRLGLFYKAQALAKTRKGPTTVERIEEVGIEEPRVRQ